ncbi:diaminopimelate epimerase [Legionella lansingensis]|uniref:Diaminopimelate epimerase n=1 Tax=Legionella lansingensis TaxID=45067 RepID=A0A0W0VGD6_9GAMM|nr:diaminopimelate epimerase [Legionella lansingensis]KTD19146.1 diaminopimelate epimerase [Legionella lansingensis]SNV45490.1 diaminopimelate epimerase [Legionella lansingensis]
MTIRFTKMHGLGNDFMVIDAVNQKINLPATKIAELAKRDTGIGFDQCLIIEPSKNKDIDFFYRIFNADGQEVGQCGNGARCLARFLSHYGLTQQKIISVATMSTQMRLEINPDDTVTVDMGYPNLNPADIPLLVQERSSLYELTLADGSSHLIHALSVGNPHAVSLVDNVDIMDVPHLGKEISEHRLFPEQTNAGFMQLMDKHHIRLRVYERGCGETKACGSGAVAAAAVGRLYYQLHPEIEVSLSGGKLIVHWPDMEGPIYLKGPATFVYEGVLMS